MDEKSKKYYSSKQEKMVADALGGYVISGSGARPTAPGDVKTYDWLVECKTHTTPDHPIFFDVDVWKKIKDEAMATHRKPVLVVDDGSQKENKTWCLCNRLNLNLSNMIVADLPIVVRKNISCKHDKLKKGLDDLRKAIEDQTDFYEGMLYEAEWGGSTVCVLPLSLFKELFER